MAVGPHGAQAPGKGVDGRRYTVNGVGRHIAHPVGQIQDARQHSQQVVGLIGAGVIGAHQRMGRVQAAVQEPGLGVLGRYFEAGGPHPDAGGEHHVRVVVGHLFHDLLRVHLGGDIFPVGDDEPVRECFFQGLDPLFVAPHPGAVLGIVLVQEHHLELAGLAEDVQLVQQRLTAGLWLQRKLHGVGLGQDLDLIPQLGQVFPHLAGGGLAGIRIPVDREVHQQRVARGQPQGRAAQRIELLAEHGIQGRKVQPVVIRPTLAGGLADQRLQLCIAAQPGEPDIVDLAQLIKIEKLVVDLVFQRVVPGRNKPGDRARNGDRLVVFEDRHPLVALLHIELVQVFVGNDGGVDALLQMGLAENRPLGGELGVLFQQGHKVGRKGRVPPAGLGAHNALGGDIHQPQRLLGNDVHPVQDIIQHRKVRRLAARHTGTVGTLARAQGASIIFYHGHSRTPFFNGSCFPFPARAAVFAAQV